MPSETGGPADRPAALTNVGYVMVIRKPIRMTS